MGGDFGELGEPACRQAGVGESERVDDWKINFEIQKKEAQSFFRTTEHFKFIFISQRI
ncbi:hypothetical protein KAT63_02760 [Candidatus Parcubacteria bacterium]|nr:hypothetical protein [Candidatus Parcubacteria bacterium]